MPERVVTRVVEQGCPGDGLDAAERRPGELGRGGGHAARRLVEPDLVRAPDTRSLRVDRRLAGLSMSPTTASPLVPGKWSTTAATRSGTWRPPIASASVPPSPPARMPSRGVTSTAGGDPSVTCRARTRASLCGVIR